MVWQLYDVRDSEIEKEDGWTLSCSKDATNAQLLNATVDQGWQSYDDTAGTDMWRAVIIQGQVNTFILRWEDADQAPNKQVKKLLSELEVLLKVHVRSDERWESSFNHLVSAVEESLPETKSPE